MPGTLIREPGGDWDCMIPRRTSPRRPPRTASTASRPASAAPKAARAWGSSARPASVSVTPRARRTNSGAPSSASRRRSDAETADWTMCSRPAARVIPPSSAAATNASSCRSSIRAITLRDGS